MTDKPRLLRIPRTFHSVDDILETAKKLDLTNVIVLSQKESGDLVWLTDSQMTVAEANWLLDRAKRVILPPAALGRVND